jgi:uncharacterized protein (TIGR03086 family)
MVLTTQGALLLGSVDYLLDTLATVRPGSLQRATPCPRWTLDLLLQHLTASLDTLAGSVRHGSVGRHGPLPDAGVLPDAGLPTVPRVASAALRLLAVHARFPPGDRPIAVADRTLPVRLLALTAALEVTAHGWDIGRATGAGGSIPDPLAVALLPAAEQLITAAERGTLFGPRLPAPPGARAGDRLLAILGRRAHRPPRTDGSDL